MELPAIVNCEARPLALVTDLAEAARLWPGRDA